MWNIVWHMKHKIASKTHIYIYEEYRVAYQIQLISQKHIYIYEEYRVAYPNCIWCFEENSKFYFSRSHIYMRNIVWHIQVLQKAETFIILKARRCQKLKHSPFCRVPCLPKAYRNQANTPSLGIALWNICGISKSVLLRAFEALGAAV